MSRHGVLANREDSTGDSHEFSQAAGPFYLEKAIRVKAQETCHMLSRKFLMCSMPVPRCIRTLVGMERSMIHACMAHPPRCEFMSYKQQAAAGPR